ncbi:hypothetical protein [Streptomyces sp. 8N616]|uniref:hypothetical protein n=1 Tax=Streptomyces sp. 8N616 TaxID=3457414 RepID=UPI003FD68829
MAASRSPGCTRAPPQARTSRGAGGPLLLPAVGDQFLGDVGRHGEDPVRVADVREDDNGVVIRGARMLATKERFITEQVSADRRAVPPGHRG